MWEKDLKMEIIFSPRFEDELYGIADFIALDNQARSDLFVDKIESMCHNLVDMPYRCRKSMKFDDENIRELIFKGYIIPYHIKNDQIIILGIYKENIWQ